MRVLVDENIPLMTVDALRSLGHDVKDIRGTSKGFTEYRSVAHHGILIVRLRQPNQQKIHHAVIHVIGRFPDEEWRNLLVVVRDTTMSTSRAGGELDRYGEKSQ